MLKIKRKHRLIQKKTIKFKFDKKIIKIFVGYLINHPLALLKGFFYLIFKDKKAFFYKLNLISEKQRGQSENKSLPFYKLLIIKYWLKMFLSPVDILKAFFFKIIFPIGYLLLSFLFFLIYEIFSIVTFLFKRKLKISKDHTDINGISFVIPTWNKRDMIVDCISRLDHIASIESKNLPKEIIVIENGSHDNTFEALSKLKTSTPLKIIRSEINLGFAKAINLGAKKAKYNYIYLMNNDMVAKSGLIEEIIKFAAKLLRDKKPFFGLSSQIFFFDPKKRREESGKNYYYPDLGYLYVAHVVNDNNLKNPSITGYAGGGSSLINKELFLRLGGYDSDLYIPLYDEDMDLSFIAWKFGFPSYFVPGSQIIHHHQSSTKKLSMAPGYYMYKNWLTFILKNYDSCSLILSHIIFYPLRMVLDNRFIDYAWQNVKIMHKILYKKILLSRYERIYRDSELINFPKFEFEFYNK